MGFNMYDDQWPISNMRPILENNSTREVKLLMGNAMNLNVEAAWMLYILSNVVRVPAMPVQWSLRSAHQAASHDEAQHGDQQVQVVVGSATGYEVDEWVS